MKPSPGVSRSATSIISPVRLPPWTPQSHHPRPQSPCTPSIVTSAPVPAQPSPAPLVMHLRTPSEGWHTCPGVQLCSWHTTPLRTWHVHCCRQSSMRTVCSGCGERGHGHQTPRVGADSHISGILGTEGFADITDKGHLSAGWPPVCEAEAQHGFGAVIHLYICSFTFIH